MVRACDKALAVAKVVPSKRRGLVGREEQLAKAQVTYFYGHIDL